MCGIAGILQLDDQPPAPPVRAALSRMIGPLACRGPDGRGEFVSGPLGFAHTRLAILDAPHGHQPMTNGDLAVVFNGEIYNHHDLRRRLTLRGHRFVTSHCDTEVLLHGYREWGPALPEHLEGMFAFAVWDAKAKRLLLARDRTGQKPLYVHHDSHRLIFASTPAAIVAALGTVPPADPQALMEYLLLGCVADGSLLQGILELPPAHRAIATPGEEPRWNRYWSPPEPERAAAKLPADFDTKFSRAIEGAVAQRLEAGVPLGCFLSGGIDSSLIAALAQRQLVFRGTRLKTFSVSMPDARYDEAPFARRVARHIRSEHHELPAEPHVEEDLRTLIATMGEPLGDSSILPTYWLSKAARQHVTVALSGDGGDELLGGYRRYAAMRMLGRHGWWLRKLPRTRGGEQKSRRSQWRRLIDAAQRHGPGAQYLSMIRLFDTDWLETLRGERGGERGWEPVLELHGADPADAARRWDFENYLPYDLLRKVDRASMAVGLEVRSPLLDRAVVELVMSEPLAALCPGGRPKGWFRRFAAPLLPPGIARRRKMGFAVPIGAWFAGSLKPMIGAWLLESRGLGELGLRREAVERLITEHNTGVRDHSQRLFALLALAMWKAWADDAANR